MCRIVGFHDFTLVDNELRDRVTQLKNIMRRGGPDDDGEFIDYENKIALGHRRLSIIDLTSAGHQPMLNDEQDLILVFNGEIYNYIELKNELINFGYNFHTSSDTEVILNAYKKWGNECFKYFNGMFAIVIYNKITQEFIFARDHAGIKPLYIFNDTNKIYFSSELRALKLLPFSKSNKDWEIYFLLFGYMPEPLTTLENVRMFPKSNYAVYNIKTKKINYFQYFSFKHITTIFDIKTAQIEIKEKLINSVTKHLISDAPIALFLSGGIDSSLLTLLSSPILKEKLTTLSISFDEKLYSERQYQNLIIDKTHSKHINLNITKNIFIENLHDFFDAIDQPTIDGINSFFISKLAKDNGFKVALSGLGADELFGGYPSNDRLKFIELAKFIPKSLLKYGIYSKNKKLSKISLLTNPNQINKYLFLRSISTISEVSSLSGVPKIDIENLLLNLNNLQINNELEGFKEISYLETNFYMQSQLLRDTDVMSMWNSLEVRVPFLDKDLMNLVYNINPLLHTNNIKPKFLLTDTFHEILPKEIWDRKKMGFQFPIKEWIQEIDSMSEIVKYAKKKFQKNDYSWSQLWSIHILENYKN